MPFVYEIDSPGVCSAMRSTKLEFVIDPRPLASRPPRRVPRMDRDADARSDIAA
jgi:hypothetical protein